MFNMACMSFLVFQSSAFVAPSYMQTVPGAPSSGVLPGQVTSFLFFPLLSSFSPPFSSSSIFSVYPTTRATVQTVHRVCEPYLRRPTDLDSNLAIYL